MIPQRISTALLLVIGCAPEDAPAARAIAQRLRVDGTTTWLATDELAGQREPLPALRDAMRAANALIICLSRRSTGPGGQPAAAIARLLDLLAIAPPQLLIALRLGACELPAALTAATVVDLFGYSGYERLLAVLREHAATLQSAVPTPEPLSLVPPPAPVMPARALRGRFALPSLERQGQLRRIGRGIARAVYLLAPAEALLISGGGAALIDLADERSLWRIDCPTRCAALSPTGRLLALASGTQIRIWDLHDGRLRSELDGHADTVSSLAFGPDERTLASASHDRSIRLWRCGNEAASQQTPLLASVSAHTDQVTSIAFSPDGTLIATGGADRTVRIWRTLDRAPVQSLSGHGGAVEALAFSPDGTSLAAGSRGRSLRLWAVRSWQMLHNLDGHSGAVEALAFSPDSALVASGAVDQQTRLWRVADGALLRTLDGHSGPVTGLGWSPDGNRLASLGNDSCMLVRGVADGSTAARLRPLSGRVSSMAFNADGNQLAVGSGDGVAIYGLHDDGPRPRHELAQPGMVTSITFATDQRLVTTASDRNARAFHLETGRSAVLFQTHAGTQSSVVAPGGQLVAGSDGETTVQLWRVGDENAAGGGQFWRVLRGLRGRARLVVFSPRADALAVASEDGTIAIWHVADLQRERAEPAVGLDNAAGRARCLAFSPDTHLLAAGFEGGQVQIWRVADGTASTTLAGTGRSVVGLAFAPDGRSLACGDAAGTIQIWRLPNGTSPAPKARQRRRDAAPTVSIGGHSGAVEQLVYSPAGGVLATGASDGTVRLWRVA